MVLNKLRKGKKTIIIMSTILIIIIFIFLLDRLCWKQFGYIFCDHPQKDLIVSNVSVEPDAVTMTVHQKSSALLFDGYDYKIEDSVMYIGFKSFLFGGQKLGNYIKIKIPTSKNIKKIILKGHGSEKVIYEDDTI